MRQLRLILVLLLTMALITSCVSAVPADNESAGSEMAENSTNSESSINMTESESSENAESSKNAESSEESLSQPEDESIYASEGSEAVYVPTAEDFYLRIDQFRQSLDGFMGAKLDFGFCKWLSAAFGLEILEEISESLENESYGYEMFYTLTGMTGKVLYDEYLDRYNPQSPYFAGNITKLTPKNGDKTVITIAGDISLADNWRNVDNAVKSGKTITDYIDQRYVNQLISSDIAAVNNEFTISNRGAPLVSKKYTLRAKPENIDMYKQIGVNLVFLANNHIYDYGKDAFLDTLDHLKGAGIHYVGAGKNLPEAMTPKYFIINGRKIAFVAGNRSEKYILTPAAGENSPGVLRCYETTLMKQAIAEARENADFVIAYLHWGDEFVHQFNSTQQSQGYEYIDAGADVVVGSHTHCLQGAEFYKGKPIIYSLGNFWFSGNTEEMAMLKITINSDGSGEYNILLGREHYFSTVWAEGNQLKSLTDFFIGLSKNLKVGENGLLLPDN